MIAHDWTAWDPVVADALRAVLQQTPDTRRPLAIFDLDNTVWHGDCCEALYAHFIRDMVFDASDLFYTHVGEAYGAQQLAELYPTLQACSPAQREADPNFTRYIEIMHSAYSLRLEHGGARVAYPWLIGVFCGMSESRVKVLHEQYLPEFIANHIVRPYPTMLQLMATLHHAQWEVIAISASSCWVVDAMTSLIPLPLQRGFGMTPIVQHGTLTSTMQQPETWEDGKARVIQERIGRMPQLVFGDSLGDDAMMQLATDAAVLLDYGKHTMQAHAEQRGYLLQPVADW